MKDNVLTRLATTVRRSFSEFLFIPSLEVAVFTALAVLTCTLDAVAGARSEWNGLRLFLDRFTGDTSHATDLLSTVATSLVTVSSITFSILLLAVQQSSAALTNQIVDQYLRRRSNQWFFGFFVGSSVYALACLGLTREGAVPVYAASLSLVLAVACLMSLVVLIYSTLDQTRPSSIIASIHDTALRARRVHADTLAKARCVAAEDRRGEPVDSSAFGYVTWIDVDKLCAFTREREACFVSVLVALGEPIYVGKTLATVVDHGSLSEDDRAIVRRAIKIERRRDLRFDPCYGVDQLSDIGWTSISTAKSNPAAAHVACHALNDLLYQWSDQGCLTVGSRPDARVALKDRLVEHLAAAYESLMVVASESLQHQSLAAILDGLADSYGALVPELQDKMEAAVLNCLSALGDHVPTRQLALAVDNLIRSFSDAGKMAAARQIEEAWRSLERARGELHGRADRSTAWKD